MAAKKTKASQIKRVTKASDTAPKAATVEFQPDGKSVEK